MTAAALLGIAPTLAKLIRMLSSNRDGEVVASIHALRRVLASVGLSLHDLADTIELSARACQHDEDADDWRVMAKACAQCLVCEATDNYGNRCPKAEPHHRMYADHIIELRDGGSLLDLSNGQCLCGSHHELKSAAVRVQRRKR